MRIIRKLKSISQGLRRVYRLIHEKGVTQKPWRSDMKFKSATAPSTIQERLQIVLKNAETVNSIFFSDENHKKDSSART